MAWETGVQSTVGQLTRQGHKDWAIRYRLFFKFLMCGKNVSSIN